MFALKSLVSALLLMIAGSGVMAGELAWTSDKDDRVVIASFEHDDKGALTIVCDTQTKLLSIILQEPRANWQAGSQINFMTKPDDGTQMAPSRAVAFKPTHLVVKDDATWDIYAMTKAKAFFGVGTGEFARVFPTQNFRKAMEPVLRACGERWPD